MKRRNIVPISLLITAIIVFAMAAIRADDGKAIAPKPAPITITDDTTKRAIKDAYDSVVSANKDFQIALLQARVKYHINEDWRMDLATFTFTPPEPPLELKPPAAKP